MGLLTYPVEASYCFKKAVSLLSKDKKDEIYRFLTKPENKNYRSQILVDEIILMLNGDKIKEDWVDINAQNLLGRTLWQVSPEIWHEAGGLARVMQYHGVGISDLIGPSDVKFRHVEPHYQYRITPKEKKDDDESGQQTEKRLLDYSKDISHPVSSLEVVDTFKVMVGGRNVNVVVSRGVNTLGLKPI